MNIELKKQVFILLVIQLLIVILVYLISHSFRDFDTYYYTLNSVFMIITIEIMVILHGLKQRFINIGFYFLTGAVVFNYISSLNHHLMTFISETYIYHIFLMISATFILYGIFKAISIYNTASERLKDLAYYDQLTHLPNRFYLMSYCNGHQDRKKQLNHVFGSNQSALLFIDIDDFKMINDYLGHDSGDFILKKFAERLQSCVTEQDLVIHLSGDEFVVILHSANSKSLIEAMTNNILRIVGQACTIEDKDITISCSIGIALSPLHGDNITTLLKKADIAMYQAKSLGKNKYYFFEKELQDTFNANFEMIYGLRKAITNDDFIVYYQPKADIITGEITGLEGLARWNHPTLGILSPSKFIPLAKEHGFIQNIDQLILRKVCQQIKSWMDQGKEIYQISVNISTNFFTDKHFIMILDELLLTYSIPPHSISLEITERVALRDSDQTKIVISQLRKRQISINIDEFGRGIFNYIKDYHLDYIKIDKSIVDGVLMNKVDITSIEMIIKLAKELGFKVITEGVETVEQLASLKQMGVHEYQGFLLCEPMPIEDIHLK